MATLTTRLEQLENAQLVRRLPEEELAYLFKHALTQESAYESLLLKKRREIHRLVAEAYEASYAERLDEFAALLTQHFAEAGDDEKTVEYATRAGNQAGALYAYTEARGFYALALDALKRLPDTTANRRQRVDVTLQYVTVSRYFDSPESNLARLAEIEPLARDLPGDGTPGGDALRRARVHYQRGQVHLLRNEMPEVVAEFEQVLPAAREFGDQELLMVPSGLLGSLMVVRGQFARAQEILEPLILPLEKAGKWDTWNQVACALGLTLSARGHLAEARELIDRAMARAQTLKSAHQFALAQTVLAFHYLYCGEWQRAVEAVNLAIGLLGQSGDRFLQYGVLCWRCWAEAGLGDYRSGSETYAQGRALAAQLGSFLSGTEAMEAAHAWIALLAGEIDNALTLAEQAVILARTHGVILATGLAERVWGEALARRNPPRWDEAEEHFAASLRACEEGDSRLEAARTHIAWGKALHARRNNGAAREHFEKAAAQFQVSGLVSELEQTRHLIDSLST
jgi:hypothetical protein